MSCVWVEKLGSNVVMGHDKESMIKQISIALAHFDVSSVEIRAKTGDVVSFIKTPLHASAMPAIKQS